jgi:hypothetical protein
MPWQSADDCAAEALAAAHAGRSWVVTGRVNKAGGGRRRTGAARRSPLGRGVHRQPHVAGAPPGG